MPSTKSRERSPPPTPTRRRHNAPVRIRSRAACDGPAPGSQQESCGRPRRAAHPLPVGFVHDPAGEVAIDPDAEVAAAIRDLFAAFAACGWAYGVVTAFAARRFRLRAYGGTWA